MNALILALSYAFGSSIGVMLAGGSSAYFIWILMLIVVVFICAWEA